jgi:hypothetical protein
LSVQQKALAGWRGIVEDLVDQTNEALTKALFGMVPLAIPVRVGDDVEIGQGHVRV